MSYYRVVFRKNEILSCFPTSQRTYINEDNVIYESADMNTLTIALVKAANDREAINIAMKMLKEKKQK